MVSDLPVWVLVLIVVLGLTRGMQFVMNDKLSERPRALLKKRSEARHARGKGHGYVAYALTCPWCISLELALVVVALLAWDRTRTFVLWLLAAGAVSLIAVLVDRVIDRVPLLSDNMDATPPPPQVTEAFDRARRS